MKLYTSGTTGRPKEVIYSDEDLQGLEKCGQELCERTGGFGNIYNLYPPVPHIAFILANAYGHAGGNLINLKDIQIGSELQKCPIAIDDDLLEKITDRMKIDKPDTLIGIPATIIKILKIIDSSTVKVIITSKKMEEEQLKEINILCNADVYSVYGSTETKYGWTTCKDMSQGHHITRGNFTLEDVELVYNGIKTGDTGKIIDGECPSCGFQGQRLININRL